MLQTVDRLKIRSHGFNRKFTENCCPPEFQFDIIENIIYYLTIFIIFWRIFHAYKKEDESNNR